MHKTILAIMLTLTSGLALSSASGCGDDGICSDDQNCVLSGDKSYSHTCGTDTGCNYTCKDGATCHLKCPSGNCRVVGNNAKEVIVDCVGNNCHLQCTNTDVCQINSCTAGCDLQCTAAQTCENSCNADSGCDTVDDGIPSGY